MTHVEVGASGPVAVGARLYRWRGNHLLGVVVKASYTLQQRIDMAPIAPLDWRTKANVAHAGDEPFPLGLAEVIVGPLPQAARTAGNEVALTVVRGAEIVLDVRRRAGEAGARDAAVGFGPVAATSPLRAPHSASMDLAIFRGVRELWLEAKFDPMFFQSAPLEQRLDELRAGDTLSLLGMSHVVKAMQTTIPRHKAHAVVQLGDAPPRRLPLRLDRLHVAPDAMVAELSFRGMVDVPAEAQVVRVLGGLETETRPFAAVPFDAVQMYPVETIADGMPAPVQEEASPPTQVLAQPAPLGGTLVITPSFESTAVISPDAAAPASLPFAKGAAGAAAATPAAPIPGAPWADARVVPAPPVLLGADEDRPPETVALAAPMFGRPLGGAPLALGNHPPLQPHPPKVSTVASAPPPDVVDISLDDEPHAGESAATERQPAQASAETPPPVRVKREKVDPWRKDPDAETAATPAAPPPPAPKASPTRPDISGGLYKKFKR